MKGLVLAAGRGQRMAPLTGGTFPKELLTCGGRPVISYGIELLEALGADEIGIVTSMEKKRYFEEYAERSHQADLQMVVQPRPLRGTAHAVACARSFIDKDDEFAVVCGDSVFGILEGCKPFRDFQTTTVFVSDATSEVGRFGAVCAIPTTEAPDLGLVTRIVEKPKNEIMLGSNERIYTSCGVYLLKKGALDWVEGSFRKTTMDVYLTESLETGVEAGEQVISYRFPGSWADLGTPEAYLAAIQLSKVGRSDRNRMRFRGNDSLIFPTTLPEYRASGGHDHNEKVERAEESVA